MIKLSRWTTGGLEFVMSMHPLPLQGAECVIQHSVPLGVVAHDTLFLPAVASFFSLMWRSRRWIAFWGFAKLSNVLCHMSWLSEFWPPSAFSTFSQLKSLASVGRPLFRPGCSSSEPCSLAKHAKDDVSLL